MVAQTENTPLQNSIIENDIDAFRRLLAAGVDVHERGECDLFAPIHHAAREGREEMCRALLAAGASTEEQEANVEDTPLMMAARYGHVGTMRILLAAGANVHALDCFQGTALHNAAVGKCIEAVRLLLEKGLHPNQQDMYGSTALHAAIHQVDGKSFSQELGQLLIDFGADPNAPSADGYPPLDVAIRARDFPAIEALLALGASSSYLPPNPSSSYLTPFQKAVYMGNAELVTYFVRQCGEDPAQRTHTNRTMSQLAVKRPDMKVLLRALKTSLDVESAIGGYDHIASIPSSRRTGLPAL